jgi:hypothetical protein
MGMGYQYSTTNSIQRLFLSTHVKLVLSLFCLFDKVDDNGGGDDDDDYG